MPDLSALALNAAHQISTSELHGAVCGIATCAVDPFPLQTLVDLLGVALLTDETAVSDFVAATLDDLLAADMSFTPLLPDDDAPLPLRLEALAQWCGSFLAGLGAALGEELVEGVSGFDDLPDDVKELVRDFAALTEIDVDETDAADESEEAQLVELQEFVKVGVLVIASTLHGEWRADDAEHHSG
ncbi:MAG: UPF0149 family protein [Pseudomonadales bacterium]